MNSKTSVIAELIEHELKRRGCSVGEFAELCRIPESRLQSILEQPLTPTEAEMELIACWIAKDGEGQTFWTGDELGGLLS